MYGFLLDIKTSRKKIILLDLRENRGDFIIV